MSFRVIVLFFVGMIYSCNLLAETPDCKKLSIPITFDAYGLPILSLNINGDTHNALFDLGSLDGIHLPVSEVSKIKELKYTGNTVKSSNLKGEVFSSKAFVISSLRVGCKRFSDIKGLELTPWAASIGTENINNEEDQIVIGLDFFKGKKLTVNYSNNSLMVEDAELSQISFSELSDANAFTLSKEGITIVVESSNAHYQMILDSGASSSIFVADKVNPKEVMRECHYDLGEGVECRMFDSNLKIFGHEFQFSILLFPIDERFKKDGILGSDFFKRFIVEIDFLNSRIALTPITDSLASR